MAGRSTRIAGVGESRFGTFLTGCFAGIIVGGLLGVLLAPHRGDITRRKVARGAGATKDRVVATKDKVVATKDQVVEAVEQQVESMKAKKGTADADQTADN